MEYALYDEYESISKEIFTVDLCTFDFLQKFRKIQTESVANYSDFLNELELIDKSDKNWVYMFEKKAFKDK
jgi:ferritin